MARLFCAIFGHRDEPAGCRLNDGPFILNAMVCRRCSRINPVR